MSAWWFVIEQAIIVILPIPVQQLPNVGYFLAIGGCSGEIKKAEVCGIAVYDGRLMRHDHFEGNRDVWGVWISHCEPESFGKGGVERYFTLLNQLHEGHTRKTLRNGGDSDHCVVINRLIFFILFAQISMIDNLALLCDFKLYSSDLVRLSKLSESLIEIHLAQCRKKQGKNNENTDHKFNNISRSDAHDMMQKHDHCTSLRLKTRTQPSAPEMANMESSQEKSTVSIYLGRLQMAQKGLLLLLLSKSLTSLDPLPPAMMRSWCFLLNWQEQSRQGELDTLIPSQSSVSFSSHLRASHCCSWSFCRHEAVSKSIPQLANPSPQMQGPKMLWKGFPSRRSQAIRV